LNLGARFIHANLRLDVDVVDRAAIVSKG